MDAPSAWQQPILNLIPVHLNSLTKLLPTSKSRPFFLCLQPTAAKTQTTWKSPPEDVLLKAWQKREGCMLLVYCRSRVAGHAFLGFFDAAFRVWQQRSGLETAIVAHLSGRRSSRRISSLGGHSEDWALSRYVFIWSRTCWTKNGDKEQLQYYLLL